VHTNLKTQFNEISILDNLNHENLADFLSFEFTFEIPAKALAYISHRSLEIKLKMKLRLNLPQNNNFLIADF